jgi:DNA replication and repair protein RecF
MRLQRLTLRDFRNFASAELELGARFTVLHGHNGAGKTNVLEAIYLLSTLRSFRSADLDPLVRHGTSAAAVELGAHDPVADLPTSLSVRLQRGDRSTRRTAIADGKVVRSGPAFYGRVPAILFTPEDLGVLRGSPNGRRQFLDRMIFARDRGHIADVQSYEKLVRSRNHVLKRDDMPAAEIDRLLSTYDTGIADVGARLWTRRVALLDALREPFAAAFARIHGQSGPTPNAGPALRAEVTYAPKLDDVDTAPDEGERAHDEDARATIPAVERRRAALLRALQERRDEDRRRHVTTVGPHRDDLVVVLDGRSAAEYASQGQARALVLAFKLAELATARDAVGRAPVLLLDDVSSELDPDRSALLFSALADDAGQCVLTTTAATFIALPKGVEARHHLVDRGRIEPAETAPERDP